MMNLKGKLGLLAAVLLVTFCAFFPALFNQLTNWDDRIHVVDCPEIRGLDAGHIQAIFTSTRGNGYLPLTILSFAVEYHFFGLNPFVYHFDNVMLHLLVVALVFWLGLRLGLGAWAAALASLVFGIHPMHVESVAWVSERKDVLYALFYLLAIHAHLSYLDRGRKRMFAVTLFCGLLSMLAKPMALSLPLVLIVVGGMKGRRLSWKILAETLAHALYIVPLTFVTYQFYAHPIAGSWLQMGLTWIWCAAFYLWMFFCPTHLAFWYARPEPVDFSNPVYPAAILTIALVLFLLMRFRQSRWFIFAVLFYAVSLFYVFRADASQLNVVADRYMYLASIGFCFLFGQGAVSCVRYFKQTLLRWMAIAVIAGVCLWCAAQTYQRCFLWKDGVTVWNNILKAQPDHWYGLYGRAKAYEYLGRYQEALEDYARALKVRPDFIWIYQNRGTMLLTMGRYDEALRDFDRALELEPSAIIFNNRSLIHSRRQNDQAAMADLNRAVSLDPNYIAVYRNRGLLYVKWEDYARARDDFQKGLALDASNAELHYCLALANIKLNQFSDALAHARQARALGYPGLEEMIRFLEKHE